MTPEWIWSLLGLCIILISTSALITVFAMGGAFFSGFTVCRFESHPRLHVLDADFLGARSGLSEKLYLWNPLTHFIDIVRTPIIQGDAPIRSFVICISITILLWVAAIYLLGKFRNRIVFLIT